MATEGYASLAMCRQAIVLALARCHAVGLAPHRTPSTLLGVVTLGYCGQLVEIDGIAALPIGE